MKGPALAKAKDHQIGTGTDCLFCQWVMQKTAVATIGTMMAHHDGNPVTHGHLLIIPRRHVQDWFSLTKQENIDCVKLIRALADQIRNDDESVTGFNIGTNIGASAGQTIFHAHVHLIPRRDGDCPDPRGGVRGVIDGKRIY